MRTQALLFALALAFAPLAGADTRKSEQDNETMQQSTSPSNPVKQEEEHAEAHSQPDTPTKGTDAVRERSPSQGSSTDRRQAPRKPKQDEAEKPLPATTERQ